MTPNSTSNQNFCRPLLDHARAFLEHQYNTLMAEQTDLNQVCQTIASKLKRLQNAYELLPQQTPGKWFLSAGYQSTLQNIRNQCAAFKVEVDEFIVEIGKRSAESQPTSLIESLNQLATLLGEASNDLTYLSQPSVITKPNDHTSIEIPTSKESILSI
jgi:hypothetical protein